MRLRLGLLAALLVGVVGAPSGQAAAPAAPTVIAVVGEDGLEVLHSEFRSRDGRDVPLPPQIARSVVRVTLPPASLDYEDRVELLEKGPLGRPQPRTLYYVRGTRLLLWTGEPSSRPVRFAGADTLHGTGVTSLAAGRTTGTAPDSLVVHGLLSGDSAWSWVAAQPWIDLATTSGFTVDGSAPVVCEGVRAVTAFRRSGRLPYMIAGNGFFETLAFSPGHSRDIVRVGGVHTDGTPYHAQGSVNYTSHGYDLAEAWSSPIARAGTDDEFQVAGGTSGSTPKVTGRAASLLAHARTLLGDRSSGAEDGALVRAGSGARLPAKGPLSDGRLTADELLGVQLATSRPSLSADGGRYAYEGFGWFDHRAEAQARAVLEGRSDAPARAADQQAYTAALAAREAGTVARGCTLP